MSTLSPELALVDPELRADAIARLPPIYVNAFLVPRPAPIVAPAVTLVAPPVALPVAHSRIPPRASAALAYLVVAVARTVVFEAAVFAAVFAVVLVASLVA